MTLISALNMGQRPSKLTVSSSSRTFQAVAEAGEGRRVCDHGQQAVDGGPQGEPPHRRQVDVDHGPLRGARNRIGRPRRLHAYAGLAHWVNGRIGVQISKTRRCMGDTAAAQRQDHYCLRNISSAWQMGRYVRGRVHSSRMQAACECLADTNPMRPV